jgi:MIP family channel proteins
MSAMKIQPLVAEFLGTFFLCFAGIAAILSATPAVGSGAGIVGIALAHGLALSVAVNAFGGISGAHFNPAVSVGFFITGRLPVLSLGPYIAAQLLGATTAAFICRMLFPVEAVVQAQLGLPLPAVWAGSGAVILGEFVMTFVLMTAIFGTAVDGRGQTVKIGGFGIGLTVAFDILAGGALTGASMNPARSFGPALVIANFAWHWVYWVAPIAGASVAAILYEKVILENPLPKTI